MIQQCYIHGLYGGEDGRPVNAGDFVMYGYLIIYDTCPQQPLVIQTQSDIPYCQLRDGLWKNFDSTIASLVGAVLKVPSKPDQAQMTQQCW